MKFRLGLMLSIGLYAGVILAATTSVVPATSMKMNIPAAPVQPASSAVVSTAMPVEGAVSAQPAAPANGVLTADKPIYTLRLNSNPTTGYSWFLVSYPNNLLTVVSHQYTPPKTQMPGAGGVEVWQFQANEDAFSAPRVIKITMMYARPWEINDQSPTQSFYVVTQ